MAAPIAWSRRPRSRCARSSSLGAPSPGERLGLDEHDRDAAGGWRLGAARGRAGSDGAARSGAATSRSRPGSGSGARGRAGGVPAPARARRAGSGSAPGSVPAPRRAGRSGTAPAAAAPAARSRRRCSAAAASTSAAISACRPRARSASKRSSSACSRHFLEARRLEADQVRVAAPCERWPAPEGKGRAQELAGRRDVAARQPGACLGGQPLEPARVDVVGGDAEDVAGRAGEQHAVAERRAESRHDGLDGVRSVPGGPPLPDRLHQRIGRDDGSGAGREARQQRPLVAALHRYRAILVVEDREVAQDGDPHRCLRIRA